jgi:hypothetical protein
MKEENEILKDSIKSDFKKDVPSFDFTEMVMDKIGLSLELKGVVKPLIPRAVWIWAVSIFTALICFSFLVEIKIQEVSIFDNFDFSKLKELKSTIYLLMTIGIVLFIMSLTDILYRRKNQIG